MKSFNKPASSRAFVHMIQKTFIPMILLLPASHAFNVHIQNTTQVLPPQCTQRFNKTACFPRDHQEEERKWSTISSFCCKDYPETILHCKQKSGDYTLNVLLACLPRTSVPSGRYGVLGISKTGYPEFKTFTCDTNSYETTERQSDDHSIDICRDLKTRCSGKGQRLLCRGGSTQDDRCTCEDGYIPSPDNADCRKGVFTDRQCICVEDQCPLGMARNIPSLQNDSCAMKGELDYTCRSRNDLPGDTVVSTSQPPDNKTKDSRQKSSESFCNGCPAMCVVAIVLAVVVVVLTAALYFTNRKRILHFYRNLKICGGSEKSDASSAASVEDPIDEETETASMCSTSSA